MRKHACALALLPPALHLLPRHLVPLARLHLSVPPTPHAGAAGYVLAASATFFAATAPINHVLIFTLDWGLDGSAAAAVGSELVYTCALAAACALHNARQAPGDRWWHGWQAAALADWGPFIKLSLAATAMIVADWWVWRGCCKLSVLTAAGLLCLPRLARLACWATPGAGRHARAAGRLASTCSSACLSRPACSVLSVAGFIPVQSFWPPFPHKEPRWLYDILTLLSGAQHAACRMPRVQCMQLLLGHATLPPCTTFSCTSSRCCPQRQHAIACAATSAGLLPDPELSLATSGVLYQVQTLIFMLPFGEAAGGCMHSASAAVVLLAAAFAPPAPPSCPAPVAPFFAGTAFAVCARVGHHLGAGRPRAARVAGERQRKVRGLPAAC